MLLRAATAHFLLIDVQERLAPAMADPGQVLRNGRILLRAAAQLGIPVTVTEQYPKGLGPTVADLAGALPNEARTCAKTAFSAAADPEIAARIGGLRAEGRGQVVIAGLEAHVCVLQTAIELKLSGYDVAVVGDAVSSRSPHSVETARTRLLQTGCQWVTGEMVIFEWLERAGTDQFRTLSALVR
jgi:nicotinamidase-related amidase